MKALSNKLTLSSGKKKTYVSTPVFKSHSALLPSRRSVKNISASASREAKFSAKEDVADSDNPGFDDLVLDRQYYKDMGMDESEINDRKEFTDDDPDPDGQTYGLEDLYSPAEGLPQHVVEELFHKEQYGPQVLFVFAGMPIRHVEKL